MPTRMLRVIGGPSHGRRVEFPGGVDEQPIIDPINIPDPIPGSIPHRFPTTVYIARMMHTPDGEFEFAAPASWSIGQVLRFLLQ